MPPRIPGIHHQTRFPICTSHPRTSRRKLTTSRPSQSQIPPESPRFIDIPQSVQAEAVYKPWVKGFVPLPRKVISLAPNIVQKGTAEYLAVATAEPLRQPTGGYKWRESELRRKNLREGLVELQHRKESSVKFSTERGARRHRRNLALRDAPERDDEFLTRPTVLQSSVPGHHRKLADPGREARVARSRENVAHTEQMHNEEKKEMLQTLYVNAKNFITTDAQLEEGMSKAFDSREQFRSDSQPGMNIWNLGVPETTRELLTSYGKRAKSSDASDSNRRVTKERLKRISEELTGGKM